jgi:GNAT superfamily N-acetyltransferase
MPYAVDRLDEGSRSALVAHFLALSPTDRRLRFGKIASPEVVAGYVDAIDLDCDAVFGVHDAGRALVGVAHVAVRDDQSELGISVLAAYRRRGIGGELVARAIWHARNAPAAELLMYCAADNVPVLNLARKIGMRIAGRAGEAVARLRLRPAFAGPVAYECVL